MVFGGEEEMLWISQSGVMENHILEFTDEIIRSKV